MGNYTMKDFISGKIVVHTGMHYQKFLELCEKHQLTWASGDKATAYKPKQYGDNLVITHRFGVLMYAPRDMFDGMYTGPKVVMPGDIAEMVPKYTMKDFIEKPIAVRVGQKHAREFLKMCEAEGLKWRHGAKPTDWVPNHYGDKQCITCHCKYGNGNLMVGDVSTYEQQKLTIVDFEDMVHEKKPTHYQIIIDCYNDKVTDARMMVNDKTVKSVKARCNPIDKFDFAIGAKVAFDRLFGKEPDTPSAPAPTPKPTPASKFKVGDRVKCTKSVDKKTAVIGKYGTVMHVSWDNRYAVEFDVNIDGHSCAGRVKSTRGWYCPADALEPAPAPAPSRVVREVARFAKVGEYVKIVKSKHSTNKFKVGEIHKVVDYFDTKMGLVHLDCGGVHAMPSEYVVLEGYRPE